MIKTQQSTQSFTTSYRLYGEGDHVSWLQQLILYTLVIALTEINSAVASQEIAQWVAALPLEEKDAILVKLIEEQVPYLGMELRRRALQDISSSFRRGKSNHEAEARTADELHARAEVIAQERCRKEAELKARENARRER